MAVSTAPTHLTVYCLCAGWCRTCDAYRQIFDTLAQEWAVQARWVRVDIEDHADAIGDVDIENFPTLLVADAAQIYFFGTVLPHAGVVARLVERTLASDYTLVHAPDAVALHQHLQEAACSGLFG